MIDFLYSVIFGTLLWSCVFFYCELKSVNFLQIIVGCYMVFSFHYWVLARTYSFFIVVLCTCIFHNSEMLKLIFSYILIVIYIVANPLSFGGRLPHSNVSFEGYLILPHAQMSPTKHPLLHKMFIHFVFNCYN